MVIEYVIVAASALVVGLAFGAVINQFVRSGYMANLFKKKEPIIANVEVKDISVANTGQSPEAMQTPAGAPQEPAQAVFINYSDIIIDRLEVVIQRLDRQNQLLAELLQRVG